MLPCVKNISIEECPEPRSTKGAKGLRRLLRKKPMLRESPTAIACDTKELESKISDFNETWHDQDRYLIGKVCDEGSSIHKFNTMIVPSILVLGVVSTGLAFFKFDM